VRKASLNKLTLFVQATNYLTWCTQHVGDPEQRPNGMMNFEMPNNKTLSFGLEIGF
jgi:hypothetical protein